MKQEKRKVLFVVTKKWRKQHTFLEGEAYEIGMDLYNKYVRLQGAATDLPADYQGKVYPDPRPKAVQEARAKLDAESPKEANAAKEKAAAVKARTEEPKVPEFIGAPQQEGEAPKAES